MATEPVEEAITAMNIQAETKHGGEGMHVFDEMPGHLIRCSRQIAVAIFLDEMAVFDVTAVQYATLAAARANPGMDQRALGDLIAVDRSTIGTLLGRLEHRGLVTRKTPKDNQRIKRVYLTDKAYELLNESADAIERVQQRIIAPLTKSEQATFMALLSKLVAGNNELSRAPLKQTRN